MVIDIYNTTKKYKTLYADPPWVEQGGGKIKRGADRHYPLMKASEIAALPVERLADDSGYHLYLWATNNHLKDAFKVIEAWGFRYAWSKDRAGLGQYFRGKTEHCLFATVGILPYKILDGKRQQGETLILEPRTIHSRNPYQMRRNIKKVSYSPKIELFALEHYDGWNYCGSEV